MDWTERHRPKGLEAMVGNGPSVARIREWAAAWRAGVPQRKALILAGPPGTGKTSAALALAADMGWSVIELNASDARNAAAIQKVALAGAVHQTFAADGSFHATGSDGGRKLIILDEADNLTERAGAEGRDAEGNDYGDSGGKGAILETIRATRQPVILIVNDLYALEKGSGAALKSLAEVVKFARVQARSMVPALAKIAAAEGFVADREALEQIAVSAEGDLRAAVRDLQAHGQGRTHLTLANLKALGTRDTETSLFDLVRHVLKGRSVEELKRETFQTDATPDDLVMWIDENLPKEYKDPNDLVAGMNALSRADVFLGRTRSTQDYALWGYASEMATIGVMAARTREYRDFVPFGFPQYLSRLGRTKGIRATKDQLALGLGRLTHMSKRKARQEQVETVAALFRMDREFAVAMTKELDLEDEEVLLLLGQDGTAANLKAIRAAAAPPEEETEKTVKAKGKTPATAKGADVEAAPADEKPKKPTPKPGQKGLFGF
jgi:replication factor C large subunit